MRPEEITSVDVIDAALAYAAQFGIQADAKGCRGQPLSSDLLISENGGPTLVRQPTLQWRVFITGKDNTTGRVRRCMVPVDFLSGAVCAMDCVEIP